MKKSSLTFPTYEAMWQFRDQSKAVNVSIIPRQHTISGLFCNEEIDLAINSYHAVTCSDNMHAATKKAS